MHPALIRVSILSICAGLLLGGCQERGAVHRAEVRTEAAWDRGVGLVRGITYAIAKHEALSRQRRTAEASARRIFAARGGDFRHRNVRYIAVRTSQESDSTGETSCMLWDTQNERLVGNSVYDCKSQPAEGSTTKFDSYSAEYVGW